MFTEQKIRLLYYLTNTYNWKLCLLFKVNRTKWNEKKKHFKLSGSRVRQGWITNERLKLTENDWYSVSYIGHFCVETIKCTENSQSFSILFTVKFLVHFSTTKKISPVVIYPLALDKRYRENFESNSCKCIWMELKCSIYISKQDKRFLLFLFVK